MDNDEENVEEENVEEALSFLFERVVDLSHQLMAIRFALHKADIEVPGFKTTIH